jgi:hypothetical protein
MGTNSKSTVEPLKTLEAGTFKTISKVQPSGSLQARKDSSGAIHLFWRYSIGTKSERVSIGIFDASAPPKSLTATSRGFSVAAAIRSAEVLALQHHEHKDEGGRPALLAKESARVNAAKLETARMEAETLTRAKYTLEHLLRSYCDYLEKLGRRSHADARSIFELHVYAPWPAVAAQPANTVDEEQIADMMRRVHELGKGRTANKLRSYVRAAYQVAKAARTKPSIPQEFKVFAISRNPAADTQPDETQNRADKRPLSLHEMRGYWKAIRHLDGFKGAVLRLHLLTGGQRIEQFVRLKTANCAMGKITLLDSKGRPGKPPRRILIPLLPEAQSALDTIKSNGTYAISTNGGETHLASSTLSDWAVEAAGIEGFQTKRIRSGVETLLAGARIDKEHRGRLQSHGISGVQDIHYNDHDYIDEKLHALETLLQRLSENS